MRRISLCLFALLLFLGPGPAPAQQLPPGQGWYVVRTGDTLEGITARFFGTSDRWRENWTLNPGIDDPDLIRPGTRLRILVPRDLPEGAALLARTSRRVEDLMRPRDWENAREADVLRTRDGVRTYAASSAEIEVGEGARIKLTEDSLVFVGGDEKAERIDRDLIELDLGQADLETSAPVESGAIEIVVGGARARPRSDRAGGESVRGRFRKPEAGGVELMVYEGASELDAGGAAVEVPAGMGTAAEEGAPPREPEKLLDPPNGLRPGDGTELWTVPDPFAWTPVEGAASYSVEVCGDPDCARLLARAIGVETTSWTPPGDLPAGDVFARVTAVAASGLDGYPSNAVRWNLRLGDEDATPPTLEPAFAGPHTRMQGRWVVAPSAVLSITAEDPESGIAERSLLLDGEGVDEGSLSGPWTAGALLELGATARNGAGTEARLDPVTIFVDGTPPTVVAGGEIADAELYALGAGDETPASSESGGDLIWSRVRGDFAPLDRATILGPDDRAVLRTDRVLVRRAEGEAGASITSERRRRSGQRLRRTDRVDDEIAGVWIEVLDRGAGVAETELRAVGDGRVEVWAVDGVGNETRALVDVP